MNVNAIKTAEARAAVDKIKMMTKKEIIYVSTDIPKVFIEKRNYMQSDEFLKDKQTCIFFGLVDEMMRYRDAIREDIKVLNPTFKGELVQGVNGFIRYKEDVTKDYSVNFNDNISISTYTQNTYKLIRDKLLRVMFHK